MLDREPTLRVMNVLFDDRFGGAPKRVVEVAAALADRGVRTTLCLPAGDGNVAEIAREAGVPVVRVDFARIPRPRDVRRVLRWFFRLPGDIRRFLALFRRERPDVVHVNGAFFFPPAIAAKLARVPLVWHLNDTVLPGRVAPVFGVLVQMLADRVVVAAEAVARHYAVNRVPYTVIIAPVDIEKFRTDGSKRGGSGEPPRVGIVANWNPLKGLEYFVRAAAMVRERLEGELEVVFVGARLATHADYARRIDALIDDLGLRPVMRDYGFVFSVAPVLEELDVLVMSSTSEASSMPVLEAMASGLPVVATDVGGVRDLVIKDPEDPAGLMVPPRNPEALAGAMLDLLNHPDKANRMGKAGRRLAEEHFSLDICAQRHLKVYSELKGGSRGNRVDPRKR